MTPSDGIRRRYSKSSGFYRETKTTYFGDNPAMTDKARRLNALYTAQPRRTACVLCASELPGVPDFVSHDVPYAFCAGCSHLNGLHQDTAAFVEALYVADDGGAYAQLYLDEDFSRRVETIYRPKVDFLLDEFGATPTIVDVGCGGGYFVSAALEAGAQAVGVDVNATLVDFGNERMQRLLGHAPLATVDDGAFMDVVRDTDADVVSMIGVIEHLRHPERFFEAFRASRASHLYYSVPMVSLSVVVEHAFQDVFPRHLHGAHTHLFTEGSLLELHDRLGVEPVAEWRFGSDVLDLFRSLLVTASTNGDSPRLVAEFTSGFAPLVDDLQAVLDTAHFCSEIHVLARKG